MQDKRIEELAQYKTKSSALFSALKTELDGLNVPDEVPAESARAVQPQSASDELINGLSAHLDQLDKSLNGKIVSLEEKVSVALALASSDATPAPVQWVHEGTIEARPRRAPQQPQSGSLEKQIVSLLTCIIWHIETNDCTTGGPPERFRDRPSRLQQACRLGAAHR